MHIDYGFQLYFVGELLQWLTMVTACFFGTWLVRAKERRTRRRGHVRLGAGRNALRRRVRELEREAEEQGARIQQLLEAERFASALLLTPIAREPLPIEERVDGKRFTRSG